VLRRVVTSFGIAFWAAGILAAVPPPTLNIYFIDVEGGQATLIVTPRGESLLIDAGFPGDGTFTSQPGDPGHARDANRIAAAVRDAGAGRIDVMMLTHFHADHDGGVSELAQLIPIRTFVDHDRPLPAVESVKGSLAAFGWYESVRAKARHVSVVPGRHLPVKGVDTTVVSSAGEILPRPLAGAGKTNAACDGAVRTPAQEPNENPRSTGIVLSYGAFRFLDVGDLSGDPLFNLACPRNLIGAVDVYLVAHHGGTDAADPALYAAIRPRVALVNNGERKGGAPNTLARLKTLPGTDTWQLHRAASGENTDESRIANLDETTSYSIKIGARDDGSFTVTNGRTGASTSYAHR
jgi:beta-lactamase superfamily II metal-dependent hydrolase